VGGQPPEHRIGKYIVKRELGRGGMGAVYLAEQPGLGREVAIKELISSATADPTAITRFIQEAQVMSRTSHPNLVQIHDFESVAGTNYIVLEYVRGRSLRDWINSGTVPLPQAFAVMHGLLQALDYAHKHAIVHRDVKPENVLISDEGEVKVADFGIARLTDDSGAGSTATKTGTTVGTPQYMSPEQVSSSKVDGRSDLYSAGIILYELACGRPPFVASDDEGPFTLMAKHVQAPPPPPSMHRPGLDSALEAMILKALSKRPEDRFQTGAEFDAEVRVIADRLAPAWSRSLGANAAVTSAPASATPAPLPAVFAPAPMMEAPGTPLPLAAPAARRTGPPLPVIAGGAVAVLVVLGVIGFVVLNTGRGSAPASQSPAASITPAATPCDFLKPGVAVAPGAGSSSCLVLGAALLSAPLAGQASLPPGVQVAGSDPSGKPASPAPKVIFVSEGAQLRVDSRGYDIALVAANVKAADVVVIADFTTDGNQDADVGIGVECSQQSCTRVSVSPKTAQYRFDQLTAGAPAANVLQTGDAPLLVGTPNRLVVEIKGARLQAWLNGTPLAIVNLSAPPAVAPAEFFNTDQAAAAASVVTLASLYVFAAS